LETEERILLGADELFSRYGLKSVTMDDIARHLGMSKKTIYQFYEDKDAVVMAWTNRELESHMKACDSVESDAKNAVEEIMHMMQYFGKVFSRLNPSLFHDMQKYYPKVWNIYKDFKNKSANDQIIRNLEKGKSEGLYRPDINNKIIARLRMEEVEMAFNPHYFPHGQFSMVDVQMQLLDHFMHGICTIKGHKLINKYRQINEE
jgi:AcrR family transcriptional regulator